MLKLTLDRESRTPLQLQIFQFYLQAIQRGICCVEINSPLFASRLRH